MKASEAVYHLKGGVLEVLSRKCLRKKSLWDGDCFVFDNRVTVRHDLSEGEYDQCHACRFTRSMQRSARPSTIRQVSSCPHCWDTLSEKTRRSAIDRAEADRAGQGPQPAAPDRLQLQSRGLMHVCTPDLCDGPDVLLVLEFRRR